MRSTGVTREAFIFVCGSGTYNASLLHQMLTTKTPPSQTTFRTDVVVSCLEGLVSLYDRTAATRPLHFSVDLLRKTLTNARALRILRTTADLSLDPIWKEILTLMNSTWYNTDIQKTFKSGFFDIHNIGYLLPHLQKYLSAEYSPTLADTFWCPPHNPSQAQEVVANETRFHVSSIPTDALVQADLHLSSPSVVFLPLCLDSYADILPNGTSLLADRINYLRSLHSQLKINTERFIFILYRTRFDDLLKRFPFTTAFPEYAGPSETEYISALLRKCLPETATQAGIMVAGCYDLQSGHRLCDKVFEIAAAVARTVEHVQQTPVVGTTYTHKFKESKKLKLCHGSVSLQGRRPQNEDAELIVPKVKVDKRKYSAFCIFDGHGGDECSRQAVSVMEKELWDGELLRKRMYDEWLRDVFLRTDRILLSGDVGDFLDCGSTAVCAVFDGRFLVVGNVGDSECLVVNENGYVVLTHNHKARDAEERSRILKAGGCVYNGRVYGVLAVSRSLGDKSLKGKDVVIADPHIQVHELTKHCRAVVLSCDGVYERLTYADVYDAVQQGIAAGTPPETVARELAQTAIDKGSQDNVSVVVVYLKWR